MGSTGHCGADNRIDLSGDLNGQIERRQVLSSFVRYMEGEAFDPQVALSAEQIRSLFK